MEGGASQCAPSGQMSKDRQRYASHRLCVGKAPSQTEVGPRGVGGPWVWIKRWINYILRFGASWVATIIVARLRAATVAR